MVTKAQFAKLSVGAMDTELIKRSNELDAAKDELRELRAIRDDVYLTEEAERKVDDMSDEQLARMEQVIKARGIRTEESVNGDE